MKMLAFVGATLLIMAGPASAQATDSFAAVLRDYEAVGRSADPVGAGRRGDLEAARRWPDVSPAAVAARNAQYLALKKRLGALPPAAADAADTVDRGLLANRLDMAVEASAFDEERIPFISGDGFFTAADYVAFGTRIGSLEEAEAWLARLEALPAFYAANIANMRRGLKDGFVQPQLTTRRAIDSVRSQLAQPASESALLAPFRQLPASIPAEQQASLRQRAEAALNQKVRPAQQGVLDFFEGEYLPKARASVGALELPNGEGYYRHLVRRNTTTSLTPDDVHALGLQEIARIRGEMDAAMKEARFQGSLPEFLSYLRQEPRFYATSVEAYTEHAAEIAKRIDVAVPLVIGKLPRLTFGLKRLPPEVKNTSSGYWPGDPEAGIAGNIIIHGEKVLKFPLFQLAAWVLHEGVPGHHLQIALAQELEGVSDFRRGEDITAFVEGWALYCERLGVEMGIYRDAYEQFGRLSYEAWRASRLVIDTGLHAKGWSRDQAVEYLAANTALSQLEIDQEIDRYIAWPGQALAYKMGELTIRRLRAEAEGALGSSFDARAFHDTILAQGPVTLAMLEAQMRRWTAARLTARPAN
jgi:uncharacterized protein (DUF885 family)